MLIGLVLKQQGKGADMGATFGGGSNTLFGAGGANNLVVKLTTALAVCFFISSVVLIHLYRDMGLSLNKADTLTGSSVIDSASSVSSVAAAVSSSESSASSVAASPANSITPVAVPPVAQPVEAAKKVEKK